jgi:hypothetical protein
VLPNKYDWSDHIKKDERGNACRLHGREVQTKFWRENIKERAHQEDLGIHVRLLKSILKKMDGSVKIGFI